MNTILIVCLVVLCIYLLSKSKFEKVTYDQNYSNQTQPPACNYAENSRVYPSGNIPASYLGLSKQEKENLLIKFMEYNGTVPEYQTT
jgi:hypothetical protein